MTARCTAGSGDGRLPLLPAPQLPMCKWQLVSISEDPPKDAVRAKVLMAEN